MNKHCPYADELLGGNNFQRCETSGEGKRRDNSGRDMIFQRAFKPYAKIGFYAKIALC